MNGLKIGFALSGSFCTFDRVIAQIEALVGAGAAITPILSFNAAALDTRFGKAEDFKTKLRELTGHEPLTTLTEVEPIGPKKLFDVLVVAPCTGSTLGRLANGISDTPVALAVKSHLRRSLPVILAVSTNDALGASMRSIALLKNTKFIYFVPYQPGRRPQQAQFPGGGFRPGSRIPSPAARAGTQLQPLFLMRKVPV